MRARSTLSTSLTSSNLEAQLPNRFRPNLTFLSVGKKRKTMSSITNQRWNLRSRSEWVYPMPFFLGKKHAMTNLTGSVYFPEAPSSAKRPLPAQLSMNHSFPKPAAPALSFPVTICCLVRKSAKMVKLSWTTRSDKVRWRQRSLTTPTLSKKRRSAIQLNQLTTAGASSKVKSMYQTTD